MKNFIKKIISKSLYAIIVLSVIVNNFFRDSSINKIGIAYAQMDMGGMPIEHPDYGFRPLLSSFDKASLLFSVYLIIFSAFIQSYFLLYYLYNKIHKKDLQNNKKHKRRAIFGLVFLIVVLIGSILNVNRIENLGVFYSDVDYAEILIYSLYGFGLGVIGLLIAVVIEFSLKNNLKNKKLDLKKINNNKKI